MSKAISISECIALCEYALNAPVKYLHVLVDSSHDNDMMLMGMLSKYVSGYMCGMCSCG